MERENNMKEFKTGLDEDLPKFGAGSEYNRDQKEEARRKKFGIIAKKYNPDAQPWILKVSSGKQGKKFRGIREGGVSENAAHFIFTQTKDGSIEAFPLHEWYNFQPIQRYKALTAEEAEEEFGRRKKCVNLWSMKMRMKLKNKDEEEIEDPEEKAVKGSKGGDKKKLMISEMDEWMDSDDMSSSEEEGEGEKKKKEEDSDDENSAAKNKKKKEKAQNQKKKKKDVDDEAFEESDDGDEEGLERDYISDSSDSDSEPEIEKITKDLKSVSEEPALKKLLTSDEESDEEKSEKNDEESDEEKNKKAEDAKDSKESDVKAPQTKEKKKEDKKTKMQKVYDAINQKPGTANASDFSSDSEDSDADPTKKSSKKKPNSSQKNEKSAHNSRSGTPVDSGIKRKIDITSSDNSNSPQSTPAKRLKSESVSITPLSFSNFTGSKDSFSNTEEAVRRYLTRKPMTTTELLKKIQSKKTGVSSDELVEMMTQILKKINPSRQRIQGKMYLSLKAT